MGSIVALDQGMGFLWGQLDDEDATRVGVFVTELRLELWTEALAVPTLHLLTLMTSTMSNLTAQTNSILLPPWI